VSCPFYGKHAPTAPGFDLMDSHGNQCALIMRALAPCVMEVQGASVDWRTCPLLTTAANSYRALRQSRTHALPPTIFDERLAKLRENFRPDGWVVFNPLDSGWEARTPEVGSGANGYSTAEGAIDELRRKGCTRIAVIFVSADGRRIIE
jgi:hypothetical protein